MIDDINHWDRDDAYDDDLFAQDREADIQLDELNDIRMVRVFGCRSEVFAQLRQQSRPAWIALREYSTLAVAHRIQADADKARAEWRWIAILGWIVVSILMHWTPQNIDICVWVIAAIGVYATWQATSRRPQ